MTRRLSRARRTIFKYMKESYGKVKRNVLCCAKTENLNKWANARVNQIFTKWKEFPKRHRCPELKGAAPEKSVSPLLPEVFQVQAELCQLLKHRLDGVYKGAREEDS